MFSILPSRLISVHWGYCYSWMENGISIVREVLRFCPKSRQKTSVCYCVITQQLILFLGINYIMTLIQSSEVKMKDLGIL